MLVRLLRRRFGRVPRSTELLIRATKDTTWLDNFAIAQTLADVGIAAQPEGARGQAEVCAGGADFRRPPWAASKL
jgi:hypothetical protein